MKQGKLAETESGTYAPERAVSEQKVLCTAMQQKSPLGFNPAGLINAIYLVKKVLQVADLLRDAEELLHKHPQSISRCPDSPASFSVNFALPLCEANALPVHMAKGTGSEVWVLRARGVGWSGSTSTL